MNIINVEEEKTKLKTGYTTGSSATAAAKAALLSIISQQKLESVDILLPKRSFIQIPIYSCEFESDKARKYREELELKNANAKRKSRWIPGDQHRGDWNDK